MNEYSFLFTFNIWSDVMFLKRNFQQGSIEGVNFGKGTVSLQGVTLSVYSFSIDGILIDTGSKSLEKQFMPFFNQQDIEKIIITHHHEDHTGCASILQNKMKVPIFMNERKIEECRKKASYPLYRKIFWGSRAAFNATPLEDTFQSRHAKWDCIETPGHAEDHVALLNRETGQLFTGDLYVQTKTKVILRNESIPTIIHSLKKVLTYDFNSVFCCHAGFIQDGRNALERKLQYLLELQGNVLQMYNEGLPPKQIKKRLFPKKFPIVFFSGGEWDSIHIINSIIREHQHSFA